MDGETAAALQSDEEWEATAEAAAGARAEAIRRDLHTNMPGIIKSFDPATQTAVIQPAIERVWRGIGPLALPVCVDVPVFFPAGGNFVFTFPVTAGDECQLSINERAIDFWFDRGGVQLPSEVRFHDLSDAFAYVGFSSKPRFLAGVAIDAAEIRTRDGATVLRMDNDGSIYVGAKAGAEKMLKADSFLSGLDTALAGLDAFLTTLSTACTGVATLPQVATAINSIGPAADLLKPIIDTFKGALNTYKAQKGKVI